MCLRSVKPSLKVKLYVFKSPVQSCDWLAEITGLQNLCVQHLAEKWARAGRVPARELEQLTNHRRHYPSVASWLGKMPVKALGGGVAWAAAEVLWFQSGSSLVTVVKGACRCCGAVGILTVWRRKLAWTNNFCSSLPLPLFYGISFERLRRMFRHRGGTKETVR